MCSFYFLILHHYMDMTRLLSFNMVFYAIVDILSMKNSLRDRLNWRKERIYRVLTIFFICVRIFVVMKRSLEKDCDFFSFIHLYSYLKQLIFSRRAGFDLWRALFKRSDVYDQNPCPQCTRV